MQTTTQRTMTHLLFNELNSNPMIKVDFFSFWLLLALGMTIALSSSCSNSPKQNETASEQEDSSNNKDNPNIEKGIITGDVIYKGIEVSRILDESPENSLGNPLSSRGPNYFYDGLEIYFTEYVDNIQFTNLSMFEINGITLDKNQAELIAAFGNPIEFYEYSDYVYRDSEDTRMIRYHISSFIADYMLDFWFEQPNDKAYICGVRRFEKKL